MKLVFHSSTLSLYFSLKIGDKDSHPYQTRVYSLTNKHVSQDGWCPDLRFKLSIPQMEVTSTAVTPSSGLYGGKSGLDYLGIFYH